MLSSSNNEKQNFIKAFVSNYGINFQTLATEILSLCRTRLNTLLGLQMMKVICYLTRYASDSDFNDIVKFKTFLLVSGAIFVSFSEKVPSECLNFLRFSVFEKC